MTERKTYVLDTSVLLAAGKHALFAFEEHEVVLPLVVIKELESKRNDPDLGLTARSALRALEELREQCGAQMRDGVVVNESGGTVRIETNHVDQAGLPDAMRHDRGHDTRILAVAKGLAEDGKTVVVVSKDLPMRLLAQAVLGLSAQEYRNEQVKDSGYTGLVNIAAETDAQISELYADKEIALDGLDVPANTGVVLTGPSKGSALARVRADKTLTLINPDQNAFDVRGRSAEQRIALAHLLDEEIGIVSLGGIAGTGKTFLALAAGLEQVLEERRYSKVIVFRSPYAVGGQELGFLPGSEAEKMEPWAAAIYDALGSFCSKTVLDEVKDRGLIEVLPMTHIRGRTLTNAYIIIDEAQNLERPTLLTALSRLGEGSKAVLSWDIAQRDNLHVGRHDGVLAVVEKLKGEPLFAHTTLTKSERSKVAALVTRMLDDLDV